VLTIVTNNDITSTGSLDSRTVVKIIFSKGTVLVSIEGVVHNLIANVVASGLTDKGACSSSSTQGVVRKSAHDESGKEDG
jgi:hypothetical protein